MQAGSRLSMNTTLHWLLASAAAWHATALETVAVSAPALPTQAVCCTLQVPAMGQEQYDVWRTRNAQREHNQDQCVRCCCACHMDGHQAWQCGIPHSSILVQSTTRQAGTVRWASWQSGMAGGGMASCSRAQPVQHTP